MTMASLISPPPLQESPLAWNDVSKKWMWSPGMQKWLSDFANIVGEYLVGGRSTLTPTLFSTLNLLQVPRLPTSQINSIVNPDDGLLVYDTDTDELKLRKAGAWVVII